MKKFKVALIISIASAVFVAYTLFIGWYPRYFYISWDEEVQLHDGRIIIVHVKSTYERLHHEFSRYASAIHRDTEITFTPQTQKGPITQILKGGWPLILDQKNETWFLVFSWAAEWHPQLLQGQNWGPDQNGNGQRVAILEGMQFKKASICVLPNEFQKPNFLVRYADAAELSRFDGKLLTLAQKRKYLDRYPLLYGDAYIERPAKQNNCPKLDHHDAGEER